MTTDWQPIETAPKDGTPILGWCVHEADTYTEPGEEFRLTLYAAHYEGLSHASDGPHVVQWGGAWDDNTWEYQGGSLPDWWFVFGSDFEVAANPTLWSPITTPTTQGEDK